MEATQRILRKSIHTFLKTYQKFTTISALLAFPFSAAILLSQSLLPSSSLLSTVHHHLKSIFDAATFPPTSQFSTFFTLKLSQTITSSIFLFPFTLSFLLISKASIIRILYQQNPSSKPSYSSFISTYAHLFLTQICNSFVILSAYTTCFSLLFFVFNLLENIIYSCSISRVFLSTIVAIILTHTVIICNLASVLSGMENCAGYLAILKAIVLIRGRSSMALAIAVLSNMGMAAIEALFHYRVVRVYNDRAKISIFLMVLEGALIAYLYSIVIVIDSIMSCVFLKSCKETASLMHQEGKLSHWIDIEGQDCGTVANLKTSEDLH